MLPNGIDVARWAVGARVREPGPLRLVTAMRLAARKRPAALVDLVAAAESVSGAGSLELTILGEGPDRRKVEAHVREHRLDWVSLPGRVTRDELRERYAAADVYLSPVLLESFGIAALEARTVGLPVIGRSGSGVGEFVTDGVNGLVVSSDSEMSSAIARLAGDPATVATMRGCNVEHPPSQDWGAVVDVAIGEYQRAIGAVAAVRTNVPGGVVVVGLDPAGRRVAEVRLHHGAHPDGVLAAEGWSAGAAVSAGLRGDGAVELAYLVSELDGIRPEGDAVARDADVAPGRGGRAAPAGGGLRGRDRDPRACC